ncbi:Tubulin delta chain [Allomyces javanicus]|nr:Tubulin delta chain [Allomyces javanicus]
MSDPSKHPTFFTKVPVKGASPSAEDPAPLKSGNALPPQPTAAYVPRCVLLDTEAKVVSSILRERPPGRKWRYHPKCVHWRSAGAANNWAYGYHRHGATMMATIDKSVQFQVDQCGAAFAGFVVLHSLAGGTGSGLGMGCRSYITEQLRVKYPAATIINQVIWPFAQGEVIVQNYNLVLTLAKLTQTSNAVLVLFNDHLHRICHSRLGITSPSFGDLNCIVAYLLVRLLPHDLVPPAGFPLITAYYGPQIPTAAVPFTTLTWSGVLNPLVQMARTHTPTDEGLPWDVRDVADPRACVWNGATVVLCGRGKGDAADGARAFRGLGGKVRVVGAREVESAAGEPDKWAAVVGPTSALAAPLRAALQTAVRMFRAGAFRHQYTRFGLPDDSLPAAIGVVVEVLDRYQGLKDDAAARTLRTTR